MVFCCKDLDLAKYRSKNIIYLPPTRSHMIKIQEEEYMDITFCPWCGTTLPEDLTNILEKIIYHDMGLQGYEDPKLPLEFKTDEWWKVRKY